MQRITIASVTAEKGKKPPFKPYYALTDTKGTRMTTFESSVMSLTPGTVVDVEVIVDGQFNNLDKWTVVTAAPANAPQTALAAPPANGKPAVTRDITRDSIERQCCLKAAVEATPIGMGTPEQILVMADKFYRWVASGLLPATAADPTEIEKLFEDKPHLVHGVDIGMLKATLERTNQTHQGFIAHYAEKFNLKALNTLDAFMESLTPEQVQAVRADFTKKK